MIELIKEKMASYDAKTPVEKENALKEILQEIALYALWRSDFFEVGMFQGGTSLRILHGLPRFSEDLDFMLREPNPDFNWDPYLKSILETFQQFGIRPEAQPKGKMDSTVRQALLKDDSVANQIDINLAKNGKKMKIKLEVDVNPPALSGEQTTFLDFPLDFEVLHQDLPSNFALKIHALLCRGFLKGRDWYDFAWYVAKGVTPNLEHLTAAINQNGPWKGQGIEVTHEWLKEALEDQIATIEWDKAAEDVVRFLRANDVKSTSLWSDRFFTSKLHKMIQASEVKEENAKEENGSGYGF